MKAPKRTDKNILSISLRLTMFIDNKYINKKFILVKRKLNVDILPPLGLKKDMNIDVMPDKKNKDNNMPVLSRRNSIFLSKSRSKEKKIDVKKRQAAKIMLVMPK